MTTYKGPVYDLLGLRLIDVDMGCGQCGKRLAEIVHDSDGNLPAGRLYCVDCGTLANTLPYRVEKSFKAPGRRVAVCQLCSYVSMPTDGLKALEWAQQHYNASHGQGAA